MKIVSIDPAPGKCSTVFTAPASGPAGGAKDGWESVPSHELAQYCLELSHEESVLLCWDAPLVGPPEPDNIIAVKSAYTQRVLERFFSRAEWSKVPRGISVLPYAGCPHWAISRAAIGLPRVGRFDRPQSELPFQLVHDAGAIREPGRWVVETHPAVAIWLWCRRARASRKAAWVYKGNKKDSGLVRELWSLLVQQWREIGVPAINQVLATQEVPQNDDELDAIAGWVLGMLLVHRPSEVMILGDETTGSFLLPYDKELHCKFQKFCEVERKTALLA